MNGPVTDLSAFASDYLNTFSVGYNYAFGIAAIAMVVSLLAYVFFNRHLPNKEKVEGEKTITLTEFPLAIPIALFVGVVVALGVSFLKDIITGAAFGLFSAFVTWMIMISKKDEKSRVVALLLVFFVVIFFWMSFHQNGLTLHSLQGIIQ